MTHKKETTIDDLAIMIGKGFNEMDKRFKKVDERFDKMDKRFDRMDGEIEDIKLRLDNVAYRFELKDLEQKFEKRFRMLELKAGLKNN